MILGYPWQTLVMCFFIFAFLGWTMETVLCSVQEKGFVNRGFLTSPICPIYGFGMVLVITAMTPFEDSLLVLFFGGLLLATTVEYITGFLLETIFKATWWDYSTKKFNVKGRICLSISICWGLLSVVMLKIVWPFILNILYQIPSQIRYWTVIALMGITIIDTVMSVINAISLTELLRRTTSSRKVLKNLVSNTGLFDNATDMLNALNMRHDELVSTIKLKIKNESPNHLVLSDEEFKAKFNSITEGYDKIKNKNKWGHKRLLKAFPGMKSKEFSESLNDVKDRLLDK